LAENKSAVQQTTPAAVRLPIEGDTAGLRGKVVLINFWTYSCINWLRSLPYVRAWAAKYKDQGLVVIGVHAPEFAFEKDLDNVRRAAKDMRGDYPIARAWRLLRSRSADARVVDPSLPEPLGLGHTAKSMRMAVGGDHRSGGRTQRLSHSCQKDRGVEPRARMEPS